MKAAIDGLQALCDQQRHLYAVLAVVSMVVLGLAFSFVARWLTLLPRVAARLRKHGNEVH